MTDPPDGSASAANSLGAELELLTASRAASASGRPSLALARAEAHARRFPSGVLAQERDSLRISALCELGREDEARQLADALRRRLAASETVRPVTAPCDSG